VNETVTPTKEEIYAKALEIFMQEMYASGMQDVRTPEENELKEGSYWDRARLELMRSPELRAWEKEVEALEMAASQAEEVGVSADTLKKLLEASRDLSQTEKLLAEAKRKEREKRKQAEEKVTELETQLATAREEAKKKPALKIRILQNFKEGIEYFKKGDVLETHNVDWALNKIQQGLAERVGLEVPVKVLPEAPAKVEVPKPPERIRHLTDVFIATLNRNSVPIRSEYRARLRVELPSILNLRTLEEQERAIDLFAMEIVNEYKSKVEVARRVRELVPTAPTVREIPPEWRKTDSGFLLPNGRFIPFGKEREEIEKVERALTPEPKLRPPAANLWRWLYDTFKIGEVEFWDEREGKYVKGFRNLEEVKRAFYALSPDEQKALVDQYKSYLPAFKYPDMETFLKVKYDMTMDDLAQKSNDEKIKLWNEFWAEA
jgi:hypothetical protein